VSTAYLDTPEAWARLADYLGTVDEVGLDTEFNKGTTQVTVWSLAVLRPNLSPNPAGYRAAKGVVLPAAALPTLKPALERPELRKWLHNAPADTRSLYDSAGIVLPNASCTLQYARVVWPGQDDYGLKTLARRFLRKPARPGFADVMAFTNQRERVTKRKQAYKECSCGAVGCRKRTGHVKTDRVRVLETRTVVDFDDAYKPSDMHPGHPVWMAWLAYAAEDAVDALELADYIRRLPATAPGDVLDPSEVAQARAAMEDYA
jgi:3'-5' exonuclease